MTTEMFELLNAAKLAVAGLPKGIELLTPEAPAEVEVIRIKLAKAITAVEISTPMPGMVQGEVDPIACGSAV